MPKFHCYFCGYETVSRVLKTTFSDRLRAVRRRRVCTECGNTFSTLERLAPMGRTPKHRPPIPQDELPF